MFRAEHSQSFVVCAVNELLPSTWAGPLGPGAFEIPQKEELAAVPRGTCCHGAGQMGSGTLGSAIDSPAVLNQMLLKHRDASRSVG